MLFGSTALEVAIGMIFVYLLLSLLCSALNEYIESLVNFRAKALRRGIELLLNDTNGGGEDLAKKLYEHGLIRPLYRDADKLPSYIPARTFALALWNMAGGTDTTNLAQLKTTVNALPNKELREALVTLIDEARGDFEKARKNIEDWYDSAMDRVSGWYKRRTQVLLLVIGVIAAALVNADSINIGKALIRDPALRGSVAKAAEKALEDSSLAPSPTPADLEQRFKMAGDKVRQTRAELDQLGLPLGWVSATKDNLGDLRRAPEGIGWLLKIFGLLLTGLAISQGAPFWFDLLNKFMVIRSTVKPKEKSGEQPSKDKPAPETEEKELDVDKE